MAKSETEFYEFYQELSEEAERLKTLLTKAEGREEALQASLAKAVEDLSAVQSTAEELEVVTDILQGMEAVWQKNFQTSVAKIISRGLSLTFEQNMELILQPKVRGDVTTVDFKIAQGEGKNRFESDIVGAKGGTVIAIVNVLVRALLILSSHPALRRILILDEPFGLADDTYIPAFGQLLRELVDRQHFQIIIVSHEGALLDVADMAYEVYKVSARKGSSFRQLKARNEARA